MHIFLPLALLFVSLTTKLQAQNPEEIKDRAEAKELFDNFKAVYPETTFKQNGGKISLESLEALVAQMKQNDSKDLIFYFGRTKKDKSGSNIIMLFNTGYNPSELNDLVKIKTVRLCPTDCDPGVKSYLEE